MAGTQQLPPFFIENGLTADDAEVCLRFVRQRYPGHRVEVNGNQGACSYTIIVQPHVLDGLRDTIKAFASRQVVQFRPLKHAMPMELASEAGMWYGSLAPTIYGLAEVPIREKLRFQMNQTSFVSGVRFSEVQPKIEYLDPSSVQHCFKLVATLAEAFASIWNVGQQRRAARPPSSNGRVGSTIVGRLLILERELPSQHLRTLARQVLTRMQEGELDRLPVVLTHGDLIPENIMVDREDWNITGLIDWAESEYLPFGMGLYVLDHLTGFLEHSSKLATMRFVYYGQAQRIQEQFLRLLRMEVPALSDDLTWKAVVLSRDIGVLLWHGFAWDDGNIDRVVAPGRDDAEIAYLEAFLNDTFRYLYSCSLGSIFL